MLWVLSDTDAYLGVCPCSQDYSILGSILGLLYVRKLPFNLVRGLGICDTARKQGYKDDRVNPKP